MDGNFKELKKADHRAIINMDLVNQVGVFPEGDKIEIRIKFVDNRERRFYYEDFADFQTDWPKLSESVKEELGGTH